VESKKGHGRESNREDWITQKKGKAMAPNCSQKKDGDTMDEEEGGVSNTAYHQPNLQWYLERAGEKSRSHG